MALKVADSDSIRAARGGIRALRAGNGRCRLGVRRRGHGEDRTLDLHDVAHAIRQRWRLVAGIFLLVCVGVGIFVLSRRSDTAPVRYRSTVSVRIAEKPKKATKNKSSKQTTTTTVQSVALSGQQVFAMLPRTRAAALQGAGLPTTARRSDSSRR